jgi:proteasome accessory factor C
MDRYTRIYALHRLLKAARYRVSTARACEALQCSDSSVRRVVQYMRDYLGAPIRSDRQRGGYWYEAAEKERFELPGIWFNDAELYALLASLQLLSQVQPGLLEDQIRPLTERLQRLVADTPLGTEALQRVRILPMAARPLPPTVFGAVVEALLDRRRIRFRYRARSTDEAAERIVSPQRLTHYRENWYLDAWCHTREALRTFALDRIRRPDVLEDAAASIADAELDRHYADGYGIFAGVAGQTAVLRFSAARARWVAEEQWHPRQQGSWLRDGRYQLRIPYSRPDELILDVLRYGPEVEVLAPPALRAEMAKRLAAAAALYQADRREPATGSPA